MNSTIADKPHRKPFRTHKLQATRERYAKVWARLILFCLRAFESESNVHGCQFNKDVEEQLYALRDSALFGDPEVTKKQLLQLSISLVTQSDYDREYSIIKYFTGILGYSVSEACWHTPKEYTPVLARILFCMQVLGLEYALPSAERDTMNEDKQNLPHVRLNKFRAQWLVEDEPTPFNELHKMLNYGLTAAKDGLGSNWIRIDATEEWLYYKGERLNIQRLKDFQCTILRKAEEILSRSLMFQTRRTVKDINPYQFVYEDFSNTTKDYYFADVIPNWRETNWNKMVGKLKRNPLKWKTFVDGPATVHARCIAWKQEAIKEYDRMVTEFLECILVVMNMQGGQTGRGEEMVSMTYMNTPNGERNIKIESGQVTLETVYHKSQAVMDSQKVFLFIIYVDS